MARELHKLTAREAKALARPGRHADGGGLYLTISAGGRRRWVFLFLRAGRRVEMGLGAAGEGGVTLKEARERAGAARDALKAGRDPLDARREAERGERPVPTFGDAADELLTAMGSGWRNAKHREQWAMTLKVYAKPLRALPVDQVDTAAVLKVLKPLWTKKPETASRLRGRLERVLDAAKVNGHRAGENPAAWRGHLAHLLPKRQRLSRGHHAALPFADVPAFMAKLRTETSTTARALEFTILTAARTGETIGATWAEVDLAAGVWTVPAARMKAGREHRVPLSPPALAAVAAVVPLRPEGDNGAAPVFPGAKKGAGLSNMAMAMRMRALAPGATVHGFRSAFRDWAGEATTFPREVAEAALAHVVGDATERAYRRGDALEKRRKLMLAWAAYLDRKLTPS